MCAKNNTRIYVARTSSNRVISIVACCHSEELCALVARAFGSQQNGAATRMWRSCQVQPSKKELPQCEALCTCRSGFLIVTPLWTPVRWRLNSRCAKNIPKLLLQFLDISGTVPSTPAMDKCCFYILVHPSTWQPSALTYGSSSDWDELSSEQVLSSSKKAKYLSLAEPLSVFWYFLSGASSYDPSIGDSFFFWLLFLIVSVRAVATSWTSNNSAQWRLVVKMAGWATKFHLWLNMQDCRPAPGGL